MIVNPSGRPAESGPTPEYWGGHDGRQSYKEHLSAGSSSGRRPRISYKIKYILILIKHNFT